MPALKHNETCKLIILVKIQDISKISSEELKFFLKNFLQLPTFVLWFLKRIQIYSICANKMSHIIEKMTHPRFFIERSFSSKKCDYLQEGEFKWFQLKKRQERFREIGLEKLRIPKIRWDGQIFSRNPWTAIVQFLDNSRPRLIFIWMVWENNRF